MSVIDCSKTPNKNTEELTKQEQVDVAHLREKNIAVVGFLSRQERPEARSNDSGQTNNPYDHVNLAITTAQQCVRFADMARYKTGRGK